MNGMSSSLVAIALLISWYATTEWQGPHGIGGLRARLANIQALRAQQVCLEMALAQKKERVDALESGKHLDVEIHRQGFILPGETKYVVPEPSLDFRSSADNAYTEGVPPGIESVGCNP